MQSGDTKWEIQHPVAARTSFITIITTKQPVPRQKINLIFTTRCEPNNHNISLSTGAKHSGIVRPIGSVAVQCGQTILTKHPSEN